MAVFGLFWSSMASFWPIEVLVVCFFGSFRGVESIGRVFEGKYGLVYYNFGYFGGKTGLK